MITGAVDANLNATIPLAVRDAADVMQQMEAVIDTGFTGFLTLPPTVIAALGLTWLSREQGVLADGSTRLFDVYVVPLIGMELLQGHDLRIRVIAGGSVAVEAVP